MVSQSRQSKCSCTVSPRGHTAAADDGPSAVQCAGKVGWVGLQIVWMREQTHTEEQHHMHGY